MGGTIFEVCLFGVRHITTNETPCNYNQEDGNHQGNGISISPEAKTPSYILKAVPFVVLFIALLSKSFW